MLNHIELMGRLTQDPELRTTESGVNVVSFTLAVERDYPANGERAVDYIDCAAWRQTAEFIGKYFHRGSMIVVSGRLQSRKWQARDGSMRISWEVIADRVYFGEAARRDSDREFDSSQLRDGNATVSSGAFRELFDDGEGELPF